MFPRLFIICSVSLLALSGCQHRAASDGYGHATSASVMGDVEVVSAPVSERTSPLSRIGDFLFGSRHSDVAGEVVEDGHVVEGEDPIQYVEPVANYKGAVQSASVSDVSDHDVLPPYTLDTGDRIRMFVYGQPNLTRVYSVNDQGRISVPLVGSVLARGRTTRSLERVIKGGLQKKYVKDAQVSIEVAVYRPFFVLGEVRSPGQFAYVYGMTVQSAVATAGGYSPRASLRKIRVTRVVNGHREELFVAPSDYIRPGDTILIDERFF